MGHTVSANMAFLNKGNPLPDAPGKLWYEANINSTGGFRGADRIIYSNDGLITGHLTITKHLHRLNNARRLLFYERCIFSRKRIIK